MTQKMPKGLSTEARQWWRKVMNQYDMDSAGIMLLTQALQTLDRLREVQAQIGKEGLVVTNAQGQTKANPLLKVENDCKTCLLRYWKSLGLDFDIKGNVGRPPNFGGKSKWQ
jgi:P27 family predicted phage terminase small subunit